MWKNIKKIERKARTYKMNDTFDILARENGKQIISFETKDSIRLEVYTENGKLIIDYHKWESEEQL